MMFDTIQAYLMDHIFFVPFMALVMAIILKGVIHAAKWKFSFAKMLGSGGMPSAHSTFVVSLATAMGVKYGPWSDMFLICLVFSIIVIYDAMNVRYQAGLHAKTLNELTPGDGQILNETLGHTPLEAFAGGIVGFMTAAILLGF